MESNHPPIFTAVSSSARQLFLLLRCIGFSPKADVQITTDGLRFSVEESRAVQGLSFLEKTLFSSYTFNASSIANAPSPDESVSTPGFQINLSALLETLQIFGLSDTTANSSRNPNGGFTSSHVHNAFNTPALAITGGTCRISYPYIGAPLSITISEAGVTTTCDLNSYESPNGAGTDVDESIPLQRDALTLKIIMRSSWIYDAITELASTNPTMLALTASKNNAPLFALEGLGGPFGDSVVDFQPASKGKDVREGKRTRIPVVAETFSVLPAQRSRGSGSGSGRVRQRYQFEHIQKAARAMALASKVCIRCDVQGVLSLQFMIELQDDGVSMGARNSDGSNGGPVNIVNGATSVAGTGISTKVSFVDFRFVPLLDEDDDDDDDTESEDDTFEADTQGGDATADFDADGKSDSGTN